MAKLVFAMHSSGRVRHVSDVLSGLACDCRCLDCGDVLVARKGEEREHHFGHRSLAEHDWSWESHLHAYAKQLIIDAGGLVVPLHPAAAQHLGITPELPACQIRAGDLPIRAEVPRGSVRPDLLVETAAGKVEVALEICVSHASTWEKTQVLARQRLAALEINLRRFPREKFDPERVRHAVLHDVAMKHWLWPTRNPTRQELPEQTWPDIPSPAPSAPPFCGPRRPLPEPLRLEFRVLDWKATVPVSMEPEGSEGVLLTVHGMPIGRMAQTPEELAAPQITKLVAEVVASHARSATYRRSGVWLLSPDDAHVVGDGLRLAARQHQVRTEERLLQGREQLSADLAWSRPRAATPAPSPNSRDNPYARRRG